MRIYLLCGLYFFTSAFYGQIINIPDANFKFTLVNINCADMDGDGTFESDVDLNDDGEIQQSEAQIAFKLNVTMDEIQSLEGIQYFTNLHFLDCSWNQLSSLDVTQLPNLEKLYCNSNNLASLDVSNNAQLILINASNNDLQELDLTLNPDIDHISLPNNQLTSIFFPENANIDLAKINSNHFTTFNIPQNTIIETVLGCCNQLTDITFEQNAGIVSLDCRYNQFVALDLSTNQSLRYINASNNLLTDLNASQNIELINLIAANNLLTTLDLSANINLESLIVTNNKLSELSIRNGNNEELFILETTENVGLFCVEVDDIDFANLQSCTGDILEWCKDGWTSFSENCDLGIAKNNRLDIKVFPNPTSSIINITSQSSEIRAITIYNSLGAKIAEVGLVTYPMSLDISAFKTGLYFLEIQGAKSTMVQKIVKN